MLAATGGDDKRVIARIGADTSEYERKMQNASKKMEDFGSKMERVGSKMSSIGKRMSLAVTAPIVAGLAMATRSAVGFEAQMRNVNSVAKFTESELAQVTEEVKALAVEIGKPPADLADALYEISSSGFKGTEMLTVLRESAIGAKAGLATTKEAAKAITTVLNAYSMGADKAKSVSDIMFKAVDNGVVSFAELGMSLGAVVATAAAAKVPFEEVAAGFATMTKGGINAAETSTALNRVILAFLNPSEKLGKALQESGYQSGAALLQVKGLAAGVQFLQDVTGGSAEELARLGMDARALKAALSLARGEGRVFTADLNDMKNASGATSAALGEQMKSFQAKWDRVKASLQVMAIEIGEMLIPTLEKLAERLKSGVEWVGKLSDTEKKIMLWGGVFLAALGPVLTLLGNLIKFGKGFVTIIGKLGVALRALSVFTAANPVIAAIIAGVVIPAKMSGVVPAVIESIRKRMSAATAQREVEEKGVPTYRALAKEMGPDVLKRFERGELTAAEKTQMRDEMRKRTAAYHAAKLVAGTPTGTAAPVADTGDLDESLATAKAAETEKAAKDERAAWLRMLDIERRGADELEQIRLDMKHALSDEDIGPKERSAIEADYADQLARKEKELADKRQKFLMQQTMAETSAQMEAHALMLQATGDRYNSERVLAALRYKDERDQLSELAADGENVRMRIIAAYNRMVAEIRQADEREQSDRAQRRQTELADIEQAYRLQATQHDMMAKAAVRLTEIFEGAHAGRLAALDAERDYQKRNIQEQIKDEQARAALMAAVDADIDAQKEELHNGELKWLADEVEAERDRARRQVGFTRFENLAERAHIAGAQLGAGPAPVPAENFDKANNNVLTQIRDALLRYLEGSDGKLFELKRQLGWQ